MNPLGPGFRNTLLTLTLTLFAAGLILLLSRPATGRPIELLPPPTVAATATPTPVRVYVSGAVNLPAVYALPPRSTVQDALLAAGGPTADADLSAINLAAPVIDGAQISVPVLGQASSLASGETVDGQTLPPDAIIDINTATAAQLDTLPGIGPALAQRIVDYRTTTGPFARIEELMNVSGIGQSTFDNLKDRVTVSSP